ncbi:uncharacterized protein LOC113218000 isoform X2 [Frankliniella occidentalis]|uniref:Uncharacterized protein LOC113218000 isoform X2 n=1 Tax=Frankliniella occidentalis TaxID=133901 RepID=A0A9C6XVD7_FRAOC|nr:uncharacterized protein LOC113218000 isoform X2 [Frankliniella occidentalis]
MPATGEVQSQPRVEFDLGSTVDLGDSMGTYFKSSFAKSMALSSEQQSKSLDCSALNAALRARADMEFGLAVARGRDPGLVDPESTVKVRRDSCIPRGGPQALQDGQQQRATPQRDRTRTKEDAGHSDAAKELARLRKELQTLQEENRRLQTGGGAGPGRPGSVLLQHAAQPDTADMVDNVLLQNQVDTLQWQLRQTENSRHMYRAVMEQVVRFLERAHRNLKLAASAGPGGLRPKTPNGRVPRSRSVHTVDVCPGRASPRDSLPDFQRAKSITQIEDSQSYSAFRDFTWRPRPSQSDLEEVPPEKLSQEAFRLLRTVQSLLNTREPDLAHRLSGSGSASGSGSGDSEPRSEPRSERSSVVSLDHPDDSSQTSPTPTANGSVKDGPPHGDRLVADVAGALRRKLNIRNSQVVSCASYNRLRECASESNSNSSTTEDCDYDTGPASLLSGLESAFSGSHHHHHHLGAGNRLEEARQALRKEEADRLLHRDTRKHAPPTPQPSLSSAEDESGFSSMGSFQEVGLPLLSSTQLNGTSEPPGTASSASTTPWHSHSAATTPSPARSHGSFHEVGLPVPVTRQHHGKPPVPIHRRWSSNPVEAITRSAYKGTEALRVLWV